jgi:DNA-binding CsgD family transcriptional regulator/tetratricopeptide (TPR) repeat protein
VDALLRRLVEQGRLVRTGSAWALAPGGFEVPVAVRDLILERLDALPPDGRRVAELIALTAAVADHEVLVAAGALDSATLDEVLAALTASGLVLEQVEDGELGYRLTHPLYYEVAREALSEMARRRAHAALARAVAAVRPDDADALGRHYLAAGRALDATNALEVFAASAQRAIDRHGFVEAVRFAEAALAHARAHGGPDRLPVLLDLVGEAAQGAGRTDAAVEAWTEARELRDPATDPTGVAATHRALGLAEFDRGRTVEAVAHLQLAAELLASVGPSAALGDVGFAEVTVLRRLGRVHELAEVADRLAVVAGELRSPRIQAQAAYARAAAEMDAGRPRDALGHAVAGLAFLDGTGEDAVAYRLHTVCCDAAAILGDLKLMAAHTDAGWALGERLGVGALSGGAAMFRLWVDTLAGRWAQAWDRHNHYAEIAQRAGNDRLTAGALTVRVWLLTLRGDLEAADVLVTELVRRFGPAARVDRRGFGFLVLAEATLRLAQDRPADALAALEGFPDDAWITFVFAAPALLARARLGDVAGTRRVVAVMRAIDTPYLDALAHRALGLAHLAVQEFAAAAAELGAAAQGFELLGMPYLTAAARLELARALRDLDPGTAISQAELAATACTTLGADHDLRRARQLLAELGVAPTTIRRAPRRTGPLSARELEVATLVADGLTNAEIAERLTLSVRTVTSHLDHVYARLGINGRAALARWVIVDEPSAVAGRT